MVSRKKAKYIRNDPVDTPNKLFIISVEGSEDEPRYFEALENEFKLNVKFDYITISPKDDRMHPGTRSAPNHVIERLKHKIKEKQTFDFKKGDEAWLVFDVDRWPILNNVIQDAQNNKFNIAISNFSFDTWLFMHDLENWNCKKTSNCNSKKCKSCSKKVKKHGFNNLVKFYKTAIERAKECETTQSTNSKSQIPPCPGSRVYNLINNLGI